MVRRIVSMLLLLIFAGSLCVGCGKNEPEKELPAEIAHIEGIEQYREAVDYADAENWLLRPEKAEKEVDAIFLYPTAYGMTGAAASGLAAIDDAAMRSGAALSAQMQASVFAQSCNLYVPYYRQFTVDTLIEVAAYPEGLRYCAAQDIYRMMDYYFAHCNEGRPFILAGHSQGSLWLTVVLEDYMAQHPEYLDRMVAAYIIGYSVTESYLVRNTHLSFAEGADDTGVIVSYNTEGPGNKNRRNCVVLDGAVAINPINWKRDETYAAAAENLGGLSSGTVTPGTADARLDTARGVVVCETPTVTTQMTEAMTRYFGPESYHLQDYSLYYMNLRQNAADRISAFLAGR